MRIDALFCRNFFSRTDFAILTADSGSVRYSTSKHALSADNDTFIKFPASRKGPSTPGAPPMRIDALFCRNFFSRTDFAILTADSVSVRYSTSKHALSADNDTFIKIPASRKGPSTPGAPPMRIDALFCRNFFSRTDFAILTADSGSVRYSTSKHALSADNDTFIKFPASRKGPSTPGAPPMRIDALFCRNFFSRTDFAILTADSVSVLQSELQNQFAKKSYDKKGHQSASGVPPGYSVPFLTLGI